MSFDFEEFANSYISDLRETLGNLPMGPLFDFWRMVEETRSSDGSVHFINQTISYETYQFLGSRNDGDVVEGI